MNIRRYAWAFYSILPLVAAYRETFEESLHIDPLPDGKVSAAFSFVTTLHHAAPRSPAELSAEDQAQHYVVFPLPLAQLLRSLAVTELHLTMNAGKWNYASWGHPRHQSVASGAELWVWMGEAANFTAQKRWKDISNNLAGVFCASLGGLDETRSTSPKFAFSPEGDLIGDHEPRNFHAFLPSEAVCTENLTPFLKLLPTKGKSGLSSLLNPHKIFDTNWHGIGVHVKWIADIGIQLELTFGAVLDPVRTSHTGQRDFSLFSLFGRKITRLSPVALKSLITVQLPILDAYSLSPEPTQVSGSLALYHLDSGQLALPFDASLEWPRELQFTHSLVPDKSALSVRRVITGGSQSSGGIQFDITNQLNTTETVVIVETAPWFINYLLNTRSVVVDEVDDASLIRDMSYSLPHGRRPTLLETVLVLPRNSHVRLSTAFTKSFIAYTEHPPDAERGWDLPPAVISYRPVDSRGESAPRETRIYTKNLLVDIPTPDFSMPYNVIIMSSTVIALFFGSIFNLLTRRFVWVKIDS